MCEHAHDSREPMHLTDVEELKGLHLKAKTSIYQHQNLVKRKYLLTESSVLPYNFNKVS